MTVSFWVSNPNDLNFVKFLPCRHSSTEYNANSLTVITIYSSIIYSIITKSYTPLYFGVLGVAIIAVFYYLYYNPSEGLDNLKFDKRSDVTPVLRRPTPNNPFMNVNVTDYDEPQKYQNYNRYKEAVYPTPETENIRNAVKDEFTLGLFQDPNGKLFERNNSQRQFISQPVGEVPSRQNEFAQWLYGKELVGKTGSIYMRYGVETPDSLINSGINASSPTNFGVKEKYA